MKEVIRRAIVRHPWVILRSEFLSSRFGRRAVSILRRTPREGLSTPEEVRISEFLCRDTPWRWEVHDALRQNPPRRLRFKTDGAEICVPWEFAREYAFQEYESRTRQWMLDQLSPGSIAVDVGANIGFFTVLMAGIAGPTGRVFSVEPVEANLHYLRQNVKRNGSGNVTILPFAAGKEYRSRNFHLMATSTLDGFYEHHLAELTEIVQVQEVPLDDVIDQPVDLVKIDVEGAELEVLEGMTRILNSNPSVSLIVEWNPKGLERAGREVDSLPAYLRDHGFNLQLIDNVSNSIRLVRDILKLERSGELDPGWYGNLTCTRSS